MNGERLLALYDRVVEAPDAVDRLRRFVLDLAIRGKLVEQDPGDEPTSSILARKRLAVADSQPFDIPESWSWVRVGTVAEARLGKMLDKAKNTGTPRRYLRNINVRWFDFELSDVLEMRLEDNELAKYSLRAGDVLICEGGEPGRAAVWDERESEIYFQKALHRVRFSSMVDSQYFVNALRASVDDGRLAEYFTGTGIKHFTGKGLRAYVFPLPPLAEQHRIVIEVDELMALCDQLEGNRKAREATRDRLTKTGYGRLSAPDTSDETFPSHARFAIDTLPALTVRADQIKQLRQTILNLAVRGKLVGQNPGDESASELLKRVAVQRGRLYKAGKIRKPRNVAPLNSDELPFHLPVGWAWTQIAHLGVINPRNDAPDDHRASFVPMPLIPGEYGVPHEHERRQWSAIKKGYTHFREGDVGLAKITPCFQNGKSTVFRNLAGGLGSGTTELHVVRPLFVDPDYILVFLKSPLFIQTGIPRMTGTAGQKRIPADYFTSSPFPLPPLAEQQRIVTRVDKLMTLCDHLEAGLGAVRSTRAHLLESVLSGALRRTNLSQAVEWS